MKTIDNCFKIFLVCLIALCGYTTSSHSAQVVKVADYGDGTCSLVNAQAAYDASTAGDTIVFPAGNCTWTSTLTVSKPLSIIGAGSGAGGTKLTTPGGGSVGTTLGAGFFNVKGTTTDVTYRISRFYFEMTDWTPACAIRVDNIGMGSVRIDNNIFNQGSKPILFYNPKGIIDHNYFYNGNLTIEFSAGSLAAAKNSWTSLAAGTAEALFIEDNHFIDDANFSHTYSNERVGSFNGGKLVVRYNHFDSTQINALHDSTIVPIMTHGSANGYWQNETGARRGQSVVEIYNNEMVGKRIDYFFIARGSANLIYNNTIGKVQYTTGIHLREEEYDEALWVPFRNTWPAEDQVHNTFIWNNTYDGNPHFNVPAHILIRPENSICTGTGTPFGCCTGVGIGNCDIIVKDRDYFLHAPCGGSDATDGYGNVCTHGIETFTGLNGASGSHPTDGDPYPTSGTMVFTPTGDNAYVGYTPYTYPHPLTIPKSQQNVERGN